MIRLSALHPHLHGTLADGALYFDCPFQGCSHSIRVAVSSKPFHERAPRAGEYAGKNGQIKVWQASGVFPETLTIQPSIDIIEADEQGNKIRTLCWHGHITNGEAL